MAVRYAHGAAAAIRSACFCSWWWPIATAVHAAPDSVEHVCGLPASQALLQLDRLQTTCGDKQSASVAGCETRIQGCRPVAAGILPRGSSSSCGVFCAARKQHAALQLCMACRPACRPPRRAPGATAQQPPACFPGWSATAPGCAVLYCHPFIPPALPSRQSSQDPTVWAASQTLCTRPHGAGCGELPPEGHCLQHSASDSAQVSAGKRCWGGCARAAPLARGAGRAQTRRGSKSKGAASV